MHYSISFFTPFFSFRIPQGQARVARDEGRGRKSHVCFSTDGVSILDGGHCCGLLIHLQGIPLIGVLLTPKIIFWLVHFKCPPLSVTFSDCLSSVRTGCQLSRSVFSLVHGKHVLQPCSLWITVCSYVALSLDFPSLGTFCKIFKMEDEQRVAKPGFNDYKVG